MTRRNSIPAIITAAENGDQEAVLAELRRDPDQVHSKCRIGYTPLHAATGQSQVGTVRLLLQHGADVAASCNQGDTPLHLAARVGSFEIGKLLVKHGADITKQNHLGRTPMMVAIDNRDRPGAAKLARYLEKLIGKKDIRTAIIDGDVGAVRQMLQQAPRVLQEYPDPGELLLQAVLRHKLRNNIELVRLILDHGVDPDATPRGGGRETALLHAGDPAVAELLLQHGAKPNVKNFLGQTMLDIARKHNLRDLEKVLLKYGGAPGKARREKGKRG